jgi:hypothetical protein
MLSCKQTSQLLSQSLDRPLSARERFALRLHLWICKYCRRFGQQINLLRTTVKQWGERVEGDAGIQLPADAKVRIASLIRTNSH